MLYNIAAHAYKNDEITETKMVQPDHTATKDTVPRLRRKSRTSRHDRRLSWRRNYMVTSMPSQVDEVVEPDSLKRADFHSFTQSLHRHTGKEISRELRKKRLLKLLRDCAESMESLACKSYVESMRSCASSESSLYGLTIDSSQDLIILDDTPEETELAPSSSALDSKHLSEIVLRDHHGEADGEVLYASTDNAVSNKYHTPKLRLANSFCSSYVGDSDVSASPSESADTSAKLASNRWMAAGPVLNRKDRYAKLNEDDYRDLVANGKSTAFLSQNDEELSLYYDDEFDVENSPLGPLHDSGLEAAICNQYASLLRTGKAGDLNQQSANSSDVHSNFSSDFENIFPASLSLLHPEVDDGEVIEEMSELDRSVPNYANMPAVTKKDYQLTFTHTESLYSDARSMCEPLSLDSEYADLVETNSNEDRPSKGKIVERNQVPKPPRVKTEQWQTADPSMSTKKVSFSDELAMVEGPQKSHAQRMEEIGNSTTWLEMKKNYTTWGQIKSDRAEDKKSHSLGDMRLQDDLVDVEEIDIKPHSLTLWELYKRTHSLSLNELNSCENSIPAESAQTTQRADKATEDLAKSINELLDDALRGPETEVQGKPSATNFDLPDLSFLRENKNNMTKHNWWREVFDQPSFCTPGASRTSSVRTCSHCERRHSSDQQVILFQGSKPAQYKICELSMLEQLVVPPPPCKCATREKLCDLSSGIATGSSGVTPREPNSWQHIADFLKRRQKNTDANSRGSQNSTLSDQQLLDVIACVEAADNLVKCQQSGVQETGHDMLLQIWKLVSALECVLSMGLKSHKLVTVPMGKIRTRVSIWDIVEESSASAGKLTSTFSQIISEVSRYQLNDASIKFCLFIVGLMNNQCLDFWLSILTHNKELMDKYYNDDSYLRSKVIADRKLYTEMVQALQHLSLFTWDIDYKNLITACTQTALTTEKAAQEEIPSRMVNYRQSTASANQQKTTPNFGKTPRYYSANNIRQAILI